jgi:hypothetical protein
MTKDLMLQTFFYCDHKDPEGLYANDVDVLEYGRKVEAVARAETIRECIELMNREGLPLSAMRIESLLDR